MSTSRTVEQLNSDLFVGKLLNRVTYWLETLSTELLLQEEFNDRMLFVVRQTETCDSQFSWACSIWCLVFQRVFHEKCSVGVIEIITQFHSLLHTFGSARLLVPTTLNVYCVIISWKLISWELISLENTPLYRQWECNRTRVCTCICQTDIVKNISYFFTQQNFNKGLEMHRSIFFRPS